MTRIVTRTYAAQDYRALTASGIDPVMARLFAARGVSNSGQLARGLGQLVKPESMRGIGDAAGILADAIQSSKRLLIVADYDADGATACAVGLRALKAYGAQVDYLVPNRFEYGYGLTPEIVRLAHGRRPDILITVDNGIASNDGVAEANRLGMRVIVTDHHLPGDALPVAAAIVNPNQPGCDFPSKHLAGVGVIFYLMLTLRAELRTRGAFDNRPEPNLAHLLDIVALGTVADVVKLDDNNRRLVAQGLWRIRSGRAVPGIRALMRVAGRDPARASSYDLGFVLGPRLNAAGRLTDMSRGIECLTTDDEGRAGEIAAELDALNRERRQIEADMQDSALAKLEGVQASDGYTLSLFDPDWHQGVIGILASRLKDRFHRPAIAFARGADGTLKGSGRSIAAMHLRDALDLVAKRRPGLVAKFGGHAAAAGLSIAEHVFNDFRAAFEQVGRQLLTPADLTRIIDTDGELAPDELRLELALALRDQVWGQGFPAPRFDGVFTVHESRLVAEKHLKLNLANSSQNYDAIIFSCVDKLPSRIRAVYRPEVNEYNGKSRLQLIIESWEAA